MEKTKQKSSRKRTYICCCSDRRDYYEAKIRMENPNAYMIQDQLDGADLVIVCGPVTNQMEQELDEACKKKIRTIYDGRSRDTYRNALLSNRKSVEVCRSEYMRSFQRER